MENIAKICMLIASYIYKRIVRMPVNLIARLYGYTHDQYFQFFCPDGDFTQAKLYKLTS